MTRSKKQSRSELEGNNEDDLRAKIETISVEISNKEQEFEDVLDTPAEIQVSRQLLVLQRQLDALQRQLRDAYEMEILGNIINGLIYDGDCL